MARDETSEAAEYELLMRQTVSPEFKSLKASLFAQFVAVFSDQLRRVVKASLESESTSEIANEWIAEATSALHFVLPELPADLENRAEFQRAAELTRKNLTEHFCRDVLIPSAEEIQRESTELAQCILANWFTLLEHAKADVAEIPDATINVMRLTVNAIPATRESDDLFQGAEAFAVSRDEISALFRDFIASQVARDAFVQLAPELYLARRNDESLFMARTEEAARNLVHAPRPQRRRSHSVDLFERIFGIAKGAPAMASLDLGTNPDYGIPLAWAEVESNLARAAARLAQTASSNPPSAASRKLSEDLALIAIYNLDGAFRPRALRRFVSYPKRLMIENVVNAEARNAVGAQMVTLLRRVSTVASGYLVAPEANAGEINESADRDQLQRILTACPGAKAVLQLSVAAAQRASSMPQAAAIGSKMNQDLGLA
jgi:hypothetical protein